MLANYSECFKITILVFLAISTVLGELGKRKRVENGENEKIKSANEKIKTIYLTLDNVGELLTFFEQSYDKDYSKLEENTFKFNLISRINELVQENGEKRGKKKGRMMENVDQNVRTKFLQNLMPSILECPAMQNFCSLHSSLGCKVMHVSSLYKFISVLINNLLGFCRAEFNLCREWWKTYRSTLKDSVASQMWTGSFEKIRASQERVLILESDEEMEEMETSSSGETNYSETDWETDDEEGGKMKGDGHRRKRRWVMNFGEAKMEERKLHFYMSYVQYLRRWRKKLDYLTNRSLEKMGNLDLEISDVQNAERRLESAGGIFDFGEWKDEKRQRELVKRRPVNLDKLIGEAAIGPQYRIVPGMDLNRARAFGNEKSSLIENGGKVEWERVERKARPVYARLYYYFFTKTQGVNHGGILLDGTEFHFSNNGGAEIFVENGYRAEGYSAEVKYDYLIGYTRKSQQKIQAILDNLVEGQFGPGKYVSEKNNCISFIQTFGNAILDHPVKKWPFPLSKAFYGEYQGFMAQMLGHFNNREVQW